MIFLLFELSLRNDNLWKLQSTFFYSPPICTIFVVLKRPPLLISYAFKTTFDTWNLFYKIVISLMISKWKDVYFVTLVFIQTFVVMIIFYINTLFWCQMQLTVLKCNVIYIVLSKKFPHFLFLIMLLWKLPRGLFI